MSSLPATEIIAASGVVAALSIPLTAYVRRPSLRLAADDGTHSRIEGNSLPYVRLVVRNGRLRRAARAARVMLERVDSPDTGATALGSPDLGWTSVFSSPEQGALVFAGGERSVDLFFLVPAHRDMYDRVLIDDPERDLAAGAPWQAKLALAGNLAITDQRDILAPHPDGHTLRVVVGAEDGTCRRYDVHVGWDGTAPSAPAVLESVRVIVRGPRR